MKEKARKQFERLAAGMTKTKAARVLPGLPKKLDRLAKLPYGYVVKLAKRVKPLYMMLRDWAKKEYPLPKRTAFVIAAALAYFISPVDAIPDIIPVVGFADDLYIVNLCLNMIDADLREYMIFKGLDPKVLD